MSDPIAEINGFDFRIEEDYSTDFGAAYVWQRKAQPVCPACDDYLSPRIHIDPWTLDEYLECPSCDKKFDVRRD